VQIQPGAGDAALQPNGDIVVSGDFGLVRYLPDGKLDTSFGTHGLAPTKFSVSGLAIQPDGDTIAVGQSRGTPGQFEVAVFTRSGAPDLAFGHGGVIITTFPHAVDGAAADAVLAEPNGDILVGGTAVVPGTLPGQPVVFLGALALYHPDGALVRSFGGGIVQSTAAVGNITTLGIDASGDIFALPAHAEFSPGGQLDAAATAAPIIASSHGGDGAFLPGGRSVIARAFSTHHGLVQVQAQEFTADGTLDPAFTSQPFNYSAGGPGGQDTPGAIAIEPNGKIVIVGTHFLDTSVFGVARLNPNGTLDSTFGNGGVLPPASEPATRPPPYSSSPTVTSSPLATRRALIPPSATSPWPATSGRDAASLVTHSVC